MKNVSKLREASQSFQQIFKGVNHEKVLGLHDPLLHSPFDRSFRYYGHPI